MLKGLHIEGRRWFQRTYGNTYHSVRIWIDGVEVAYLPYQYGYGDQFLETALDWLREQKMIPDVCARCGVARAEHGKLCKVESEYKLGFMSHYGTRYLREELGGTYSVIDVQRKKDL
jgi:hypothetical protein